MAKNQAAYFLSTQSWIFFNGIANQTAQLLLTGDTDDTWVYDIVVTSSASNALNATLYIEQANPSSNQIVLKKLISPNNILAGQGITTANPLRLMQSSDGNQNTVRLLDRDQNFYLPVPAGVKLYFKLDTTPTAGTVNVAVFKRDFTG